MSSPLSHEVFSVLGTPQKLTDCDIQGNRGWIVMGENNTINVEAPPGKGNYLFKKSGTSECRFTFNLLPKNH